MRSNVTIFYHPENKNYTYKSYVANEPLEVEIKPEDDNYKLVDRVYKLQDDTPKAERAELLGNAQTLQHDKQQLQGEKQALTSANQTLEEDKQKLQAKTKELEHQAKEKDQAIMDLISAGQATATTELIELYPPILLGGYINAGDVMQYEGHLYIAKVDISNVSEGDLPTTETGKRLWRGGAIEEEPDEPDEEEEEPSGYKYKRGDTLEWSGALYVCLKDTNGDPGESPYPVWDLAENHPELIN